MQLVALEPIYRKHDRFWVTFDKEDARSALAGERIYTCAFPTNRNIPNLVRNLWLAVKVLHKERPDVILSTGAAVAIPFFAIGRFFGAKLVYLEVFDRIDSPTITGRICERFAHLFALQWDEQRAHYRRGVVIGTVL